MMLALKIVWKKDDFGMEELTKAMQKLKPEDTVELHAAGCDVTWCVQSSGLCLYTPAGWLAAEYASKGVLIYGLCKTILPKCGVAVENYGLLMGLLQWDKKPVGKYKTTCLLLEPGATED